TTLPLSKPYYVFQDISFEHLVLNTDFPDDEEVSIKQETHNYPMSNYGLLRNEYYNVFLKYGHNSESHAHPDVMSLEVTAHNKYLTRDLSNAGYKSKMYREWHRTTPAHTTVTVDGSNQLSAHPGKTIVYDSGQITAECKDVYPGVDYQREVRISEKTLSDRFIVNSNENHNYDYFFHFESAAELNLTGQFEKAELGYTEPWYTHLQNVRKLNSKEDLYKFSFRLGCDEFQACVDLAGKELYVVDSYDNPVNKMRKTLIIRQQGKNVEFKLEFRMV
ncbi:MAG TPA: heparinase II/III family protein, partial [Bacilli bacterium]